MALHDDAAMRAADELAIVGHLEGVAAPGLVEQVAEVERPALARMGEQVEADVRPVRSIPVCRGPSQTVAGRYGFPHEGVVSDSVGMHTVYRPDREAHSPYAGEDLRLARMAARVAMTELAKAGGMSVSGVRRIERAPTGRLRTSTVRRFLDALAEARANR